MTNKASHTKTHNCRMWEHQRPPPQQRHHLQSVFYFNTILYIHFPQSSFMMTGEKSLYAPWGAQAV